MVSENEDASQLSSEGLNGDSIGDMEKIDWPAAPPKNVAEEKHPIHSISQSKIEQAEDIPSQHDIQLKDSEETLQYMQDFSLEMESEGKAGGTVLVEEARGEYIEEINNDEKSAVQLSENVIGNCRITVESQESSEEYESLRSSLPANGLGEDNNRGQSSSTEDIMFSSMNSINLSDCLGVFGLDTIDEALGKDSHDEDNNAKKNLTDQRDKNESSGDSQDHPVKAKAGRTSEEILLAAGVLKCPVSELQSIDAMEKRITKVKPSTNNIESTTKQKKTDSTPQESIESEKSFPIRQLMKNRSIMGLLNRSRIPVVNATNTKEKPGVELLEPFRDGPGFYDSGECSQDSSKLNSSSRLNYNEDDLPTSGMSELEQEKYNDIYMLHHMFKKFSTPAPSLETVCELYEIEWNRMHNVNTEEQSETQNDDLSNSIETSFPQDVLIHVGCPASEWNSKNHKSYKEHTSPHCSCVARLLSTSPHDKFFLELPIHFQLTFLRILIRLLTNESNQVYDEECLFAFFDEYAIDDENNAGFMNSKDDTNDCSNQPIVQNKTNSPHSNIKGLIDSNEISFSSDSESTISNLQLDNENKQMKNTKQESDVKENTKSIQLPETLTRSIISSSADNVSNEVNNETLQPNASKDPPHHIQRGEQSTGRTKILKHRKRQSKIFERRKKWLNSLITSQKFSSSQSVLGLKSNRLYSVVRFRCDEEWDVCPIDTILRIFELVLTGPNVNEENKKYSLLGPLSRLLGLLCTAGISVKQLRRILTLISYSSKSSNISLQEPIFVPTLARLHLVRALTFATEGASLATKLLGKASPRCFFSIGRGTGLTRHVPQSLAVGSSWPFKTHFGMACWFRVESFCGIDNAIENVRTNTDPLILSIRTDDGAGIEIWLDVFNASNYSQNTNSTGTASTLVVTVFDSTSTLAKSSASNLSSSHSVRLTGCPLVPGSWYHLAVRHNRPALKDYLTLALKDEISILLDGNLMLTEPLKFPKVSSVTTKSRFSSSTAASNIGGFRLTFGSNFNGQTGALYLFNDHVSDASLRALYEVTAGVVGPTNGSNLTPNKRSSQVNWTSTLGSLAREEAEATTGLMPADVDEIVISEEGDANLVSGRRDSTSGASVLDLASEECDETNMVHSDLSKALFVSKLLLVWDPSRSLSGKVILEAHSGVHVTLENERVHTWQVQGTKDVIGSIGGVQALLPLFRSLLSGGVESGWLDDIDGKEQQRRLRTSMEPLSAKAFCCRSIIIPCLITLLSAFLRDHDDNAREILRCGGIEIIEQCILENKFLFLDVNSKQRQRNALSSLISVPESISSFSSSNRFKWTVLTVLRASPKISRELIDSLLDLCSAASHNLSLEAKIYSRLLCNIPLWLGGISNCPGVALHASLLPSISSMAKSNPKKVGDCINVKEIMELIREYTTLHGSEDEKMTLRIEPSSSMFDRSQLSGLSPDFPLTLLERRHVVDVLFGILVTILSSKTTAPRLLPILSFISYNMDMEWEAANDEQEMTTDPKPTLCTRVERFIATKKACTILLFLMQSRPLIPQFYESLSECFSNEGIIASWILCCLVNTFDDLTRSLGIRSLTNFLDVFIPNRDGTNVTSLPIEDDNISIMTDKSRGDVSIVTSQIQAAKGAASSLRTTMKYVGGFGTGQHKSFINSPKINAKIVYKLLWHLLKCHRYRLGNDSHSALVDLLVDEGPLHISSVNTLLQFDKIVVPDAILQSGFCLNEKWAQNSLNDVGRDINQRIRSGYAISTIMRLLRFLPTKLQKRWLFDLLALIRVSPTSVKAIVAIRDWQPCLFNTVSESIEELVASCSPHTLDEETPPIENKEGNNANNAILESNPPVQSSNDSNIRARFDLSLKVYSTLLGYCVRQGGDKAFNALEQAASLQRVCLNGPNVLCVVFSHLLAELIENGTVPGILTNCPPDQNQPNERNKALKESSRLVTKSILSNGSDGMDMASAVRQWRCLRHLTAITVAIVTASGFGVAELFDYRNHDASAVDKVSNGLHGIRLPETSIVGITASELVAEVSSMNLEEENSADGSSKLVNNRRICVVLASQLLSLLDAFIFPDNLDHSRPTSQLHGLALVRSTEPRLGQTQGPLLASLVRLSLLLLSHLEPSSVKYLQCCSRLRCFLHWALELLRESVSLAGYSAAFHELTAPLDRLILAVVLQCHRSLSRCSAVLIEIEASPVNKYFPSINVRNKNYKRIFRATQELREIVLAAFRGRNEVLRAALSLQAYEALHAGLEEITSLQKKKPKPKSSTFRPRGSTSSSSKEASLRAFLANAWVTGFHDVEMCGDIAIPEQVANGQVYRHRTAGDRGRLVVEELATESKAIIDEYNRLLDVSFDLYCEDQKQWAETDAVRNLEFEGDQNIKRLSSKYRSDMNENQRILSIRVESAKHRWGAIERKVYEPWSNYQHWKLARQTDRLHRRILLVPNRNFDDHSEASYELMLGKEREKAAKYREERLRLKREKEQKEKELRLSQLSKPSDGEGLDSSTSDDNKVFKMVRVASMGIIPFAENTANDDDDDDDITLEPDNPEKTIEHEESILSSNDQQEGSLEDSDWDKMDLDQDDVDEEKAVNANEDSIKWAKVFIWSEGEQVVYKFNNVILVTLQTLTEGELLLTTHGLYFHPTGEEINVMTKEKLVKNDNPEPENTGLKDQRWRLSRLTEVHGRRYMLRAHALELFFADTFELFINFNGGTKERDKFYNKLRNNCKVPMLCSPKSLNPRTVLSKSRLTELWRKRKISNFQYLMQLNIMAGRTFNDITQYPVFPWVLSDFTSETLDLQDSRTFRDLSKPVGALNPDRLAQLIERYNNFDGFPEEEKFLYGSHYSSPGVVLHYLIRQEPFTTMAIELQSGRFDCPDRLFFDVAGCWKSCLESTSDVKELVPEFFTCPEIFLNTNNFPLGETQSKIDISNVILPPWAKGSPYEFVRLHRLALESEYVSQNLHHWVDLIFGYKQRGAEATKAHNIFHYLSYEGSVDLDKITDELNRKATESHIQNFGQTPSQLILKYPHPCRYPAEDCWKPLISETSSLKGLRFHTPSKQFSGDKLPDSRGAVLSIHPFAEQIFVIYSDLSIGNYRWATTRSGSTPFMFKMDKLRSLGCRDMSMSSSAVNGRLSAPVDGYLEKSNIDCADNWTKNGFMGVGHWSFGFTLGGSVKDLLRRRALTITSRSKEMLMSSTIDTSLLFLSCGYYDNSVKLHSFDGLRIKCSENGGHRGAINCLCIGNDGGLMVSGGQDATCRVWIIDHADMATALTDGYVQTALGKKDSGVKDSILKCCQVLWGHEAPVSCLSFSSDLDILVSGSVNGCICVHTARRGKFVRSIWVHDFLKIAKNCGNKLGTAIRKIALNDHGTFVAHLENYSLLMYTVNGVKLGLVDAGEKLNAMEIVPGGDLLVTGGERCQVVIRTLRDLGVRCIVDLKKHGPIRCISCTPSELNPAKQFMYVGSENGKVTIISKNQPSEKSNEDSSTISYASDIPDKNSYWWSEGG